MNCRIYVVDDEANITRTWALILSRAGHDVSTFDTAEGALAAIRCNPPKVLLSDVGLPGMSGIELAMILQNEKVATHIVLISGQTTTAEDVDHAALHGFSFEVLAKPVGPNKLLNLVSLLCQS